MNNWHVCTFLVIGKGKQLRISTNSFVVRYRHAHTHTENMIIMITWLTCPDDAWRDTPTLPLLVHQTCAPFRVGGSVSAFVSLWLQRRSWCQRVRPQNLSCPASPVRDLSNIPSAAPAVASGWSPHTSAQWPGGCIGSSSAPRQTAAPPCPSSAAPAALPSHPNKTCPQSPAGSCLEPGPQTRSLALTPFSCSCAQVLPISQMDSWKNMDSFSWQQF